MSDLEGRVRRALDHEALSVDISVDLPTSLLKGIRRRRRLRFVGGSAIVLLATAGLLSSLTMLKDGDATDVAAGHTESGHLSLLPPSITGSILGNVGVDSCDSTVPGEECAYGPVRFEIASAGTMTSVSTGTSSGALVHVLPDGRYVSIAPDLPPSDRSGSGGPGLTSELIDPEGGSPLTLGKDVFSPEVLPDGRLIMLATNASDERVLRTMDPKTGSAQDRSLPSGAWSGSVFDVAVTAGPDGSIAVVAKAKDWRDPFELLVISPDGKERRHHLAVPGRRESMEMPLDASWGASGLIAISARAPESVRPYDPQPGWTDVVDATSGDLVVSIEDWQGTAWSPDGRGLLLARRVGPRASELAVWWGPGLKERIDLGRSMLPVVPVYWGTPQTASQTWRG